MTPGWGGLKSENPSQDLISEYLVVLLPFFAQYVTRSSPPGRGTLAVAWSTLNDRLGPIGQFPIALTVLILPPIACTEASNFSS